MTVLEVASGEGQPSPRRIAIIGTASVSRPYAPKAGEGWERWGVGMPNAEAGDYDRFFEIHDPALFYIESLRDYVGWLQALPCPVYAFYDLPGVPNVVQMPRRELESEFDTWFLTSSIAWMLALAIHEKVDEIGLWGIEMAAGSEYADQRPGCLHFIDYARRSGIKITLPRQSALLNTGKPYPFNVEEPMARRLIDDKAKVEDDLKTIDAQVEALRLARAKVEGQKDAMMHYAKAFGVPL